MIAGENVSELNERVNKFLKTIDARQIIKIDSNVNTSNRYCAITYLELDDIRDIKLDMLIK